MSFKYYIAIESLWIQFGIYYPQQDCCKIQEVFASLLDWRSSIHKSLDLATAQTTCVDTSAVHPSDKLRLGFGIAESLLLIMRSASQTEANSCLGDGTTHEFLLSILFIYIYKYVYIYNI